ncbi:hypothetical protein SMICM304S_06058 [Streptomyces microflavus]
MSLKPVPAVGTVTGKAPARAIMWGKLTQYGAGRITSSPGSHRTVKTWASACLAPFVVTICAAS